MNRNRGTLLLLTFLLLILPAALPAQTETGFRPRTVAVKGQTFKYQVYVPPEWKPGGRQWPVILFLHGAGARGDDGVRQANIGLGKAIRKDPQRFPFIVIFPQAHLRNSWSTPAMQAQALAALDQTMQEFNGDPSRVYLTGLSFGGYGTWVLARNNPGKFAAIIPICGGVQGNVGEEDRFQKTARLIGNTPAWIFHGEADRAVPPTGSRRMHEEMKKLGTEVRYTEYERMGHSIWDRVYAEAELVPWLLSHKLTKTATTSSQ